MERIGTSDNTATEVLVVDYRKLIVSSVVDRGGICINIF